MYFKVCCCLLKFKLKLFIGPKKSQASLVFTTWWRIWRLKKLNCKIERKSDPLVILATLLFRSPVPEEEEVEGLECFFQITPGV